MAQIVALLMILMTTIITVRRGHSKPPRRNTKNQPRYLNDKSPPLERIHECNRHTGSVAGDSPSIEELR